MPISQYDTLNYALYQPLSIQEIWAPGQQLRQQHDQLQEDYSNAEQAAQQGFSGLNPEIDKEALAIHKQFMDQTKAAADELATKGFIDAGRRRNLIQLKSLYSNQVAPLQQQIALRAARAEELRKIRQEHPDFISIGDPMSVGLVNGLKNSNAYDYVGMKGDVLTKSVAEKAIELGKRIDSMPKYKHTNIPFNMFALLKSGASAEDVGKAMLHAGYKDEDAKGIVGELQNIVRGTLDQYQIDNKFGSDPGALKKAYDFANAGLYKAIGDNKPMSAEDQYGLHMAELKASKKDEYQPTYPNRDISYSPEVSDSDKYKEISDLINHISKGRYISSKIGTTLNPNKAQSGVMPGGFPIYSKDRTENDSRMPVMDNKYNKKIEEIAKQYKTTDLQKIKSILEVQQDNLRKMNATRYIDDNSDEAKKHFLNNIMSNSSQAKLVKDQTGMSPQELMNSKELEKVRFGINARKGLTLEYRKDPNNIKKSYLDYSVSGNPNHSQMIKINNAYSSAYEGKLTPNDLISTGKFIEYNGKYIMPDLVDRNGNPVSLTKSEISNGLDSPNVRVIFDALMNRVDSEISSNAWSNIKAKETEIGGGK